MQAADSTAILDRIRERTRLRLYHATLPQLDDNGYLDFDAEKREITDVHVPPAVESLLEEGGP